jgi:hypothetical protein
MWRRRRASSGAEERAPGDLFDAPESDLASFGDSGARGFSDAWDDHAASPQSGDASAFAADHSVDKARDLDRSSRRGLVALGLVVVIGVLLAMSVRNDWFGTGPQSAAFQPDSTQLLAPSAPRTYEPGPAVVELVRSIALVDLFRSTDGDPSPKPVELLADFPNARAGLVFWAGRLHVGIFGRGVSDPSNCLVATLVTDDLQVIDVAGSGACNNTYAATGDRLACVGDNLVLLEVWPTDPSSIAPKPPVVAMRVRIERRSDGGSESARAMMQFDTALTAVELAREASTAGGAPGDTVIIDGDASSPTCVLRDRAGIAVRLLPS